MAVILRKFTHLRELIIFYLFYVHQSIRVSFSMHLVIFVAPIFQLNTLKDDFGAFVMITLR